MKVAGFDISTKAIDCVLVDLDDQYEDPQWLHFALSGADAWERVRGVSHLVPSRGWWLEQGLYAAGCEVPFGFSSAKVAMVIGALLNRLPDNIMIERWPHNSWRVALGLKGSGKSADLKSAARVKSLEELYCEETGPACHYYGGAPVPWTIDAHEAHLIALATIRAIDKAAAA